MNQYKKIYIFLTFFSFSLFFLYLFFTRSENIGNYFFYDTLDTGMDFFNSILYTKGRHPYTQYHTIYPPLANFIFWVIYHCIPPSITTLWPEDFSGSVNIRGTSIDLRISQIPMFAFILFFLITAVLFIYIIAAAYQKSNLGFFMGFCLILSFGSLFALERGNIILLSTALLLIFTIFYDSPNKFIQEIAIISLALSAGLKLYPALFGFLLLSKKKWSLSFRAILYGVFFFCLPFALFDGLDGFIDFFHSLIQFSSQETQNRMAYYNIEELIKSIIFQFSNLFSYNYEIAIAKTKYLLLFFKYLVVFLLLLCSFLPLEEWKKMLALGLIILFLQTSVGYTLLFLIPAFVQFCKEENYHTKNIIYFTLLCIINLPPIPLGNVTFSNINLSSILRQYTLLILTILLIYDTITFSFQLVKQKKNTPKHT